MTEKIHAKWKQFWQTLGLRHLGVPPEEYIPTPKDRCEYGFKHGYGLGHTDGVKEATHEVFELCVGLLYHQYQTLKTFHSKDDERCLLIKNCILEIREAMAQHMEAGE